MLLENKKTQIDDLLDKMAEGLQLDESRYNRIIKHYESVKKWIEDDEKFFKPFKYDVYPHGSVRILTTVKPIGKDEFDLDIAIHLKTEWANHTPEKVYKELKRRLEEHETYKSMLEAKNRCIRLNYSGDFHMDILPGIQENENDENRIRIPDRELGHWVSSNPRGYANWFLKKAHMVKVSLLEKALKAEKVPTDNFENKKPLQRAVQLFKRYRDVYFHKDDTYKTSSIVLTTIAGEFYNGEESIYDTIDSIITKIRTNIAASPNVRFKVLNPVNSDEDFTDKWEDEPGYYKAFQKFCNYLYEQWQELKKENGIIEEGKLLKGLFGDDVYINAQRKQTESLENLRKNKTLGVNQSTGTLGTIGATGGASIAVKHNTFYGD